VKSTLSPDAALASLRLGFVVTLTGWPVLLGRAIFYVLLLIILTALWDKVMAEPLRGGLVGALPAGGLAVYVGVTEWVGLSAPAVHLRLEDDIRSGALEAQLPRPKSWLVLRVAEAVGALLARLAFTGVAALCLLALSGRLWPSPVALVALAIIGPLGGIVGVLLFTLAGLSAFWLRRVLPVFLILQKMLFLLGGLFAPVTLYPGWLARVGLLSPFAAHLYWPAMMTISPTPTTIVLALMSQLVWIVLLTAVIALVWRAGLRRVLRGDLR
jgi:ABC-2 type transport system permease protein